MKLVVLAAVALTGCLRQTEFHCSNDTECGTQGQCESNGFCSVPDINCITGRHYTSFSGDLTNRCVLGPDAPGPSKCAPAFGPLPGVPDHVYFLFTTDADYDSQKGACSVQGPGSYLAIPDDVIELAALTTLASQPSMWVGVDDELVEGNYVTSRGQPAPFLPWGAGQPDDQPPGEDCVAAIASGNTYDDQPCSNSLRAVCECEP